jgi:hypothetical protein
MVTVPPRRHHFCSRERTIQCNGQRTTNNDLDFESIQGCVPMAQAALTSTYGYPPKLTTNERRVEFGDLVLMFQLLICPHDRAYLTFPTWRSLISPGAPAASHVPNERLILCNGQGRNGETQTTSSSFIHFSLWASIEKDFTLCTSSQLFQ